MSKIIFTSRYIKNPASSNAGKLIKYMGTREGVEKLPNGIDYSPATKKQNDLICIALKTVPESWDYPEMKSYLENKTKSNATEFLNEFLERNADRIGGVKKLVNYYAERPGVEKLGKHGLFSQTDEKINLDEVADKVSNHNGIVWTHVISLKREDAERLGYNNANAWKSLIRRNALEIAKAHKIEPSDLQWYGAFHNTTHHPHIHLMIYSKSGQGYLTNKGIESMRSALGNCRRKGKNEKSKQVGITMLKICAIVNKDKQNKKIWFRKDRNCASRSLLSFIHSSTKIILAKNNRVIINGQSCGQDNKSKQKEKPLNSLKIACLSGYPWSR